VAEYDIPTVGSGPRALLALTPRHLFFSQHDIGGIGEVIIE